jgi:hypothetical protein
MAENGCVKLYPASQGVPKVKYVLQGQMFGKGSLLATPSGPLGTSLAQRTLFRTYLTVVTSLFLLSWSSVLGMPHLPVEGLGHCPYVMATNLPRGSGEAQAM